MDIKDIKERFSIIGFSPLLDKAIKIAQKVAPTEMSVLIMGESGSGKEVFSKIIHALSSRKHGPFIAVNCGALPAEGTINSELFGHAKGAFTNALEERKGYFEATNGGTIFLDEVAELPLDTQARLLRVLEAGEYLSVGSSKVKKTNVRIVAATNVNLIDAVERGKFREDLYYRLNTTPLRIPALRDRKEDIHLIFRKFVGTFNEKYRLTDLTLTADAVHLLENYTWPGNVRQLKNIAEQIAVLEKGEKGEKARSIDAGRLRPYIPAARQTSQLPMRINNGKDTDFSERDILYKVLFDMRQDITDLKRLVSGLIPPEKLPPNFRDEAAPRQLIAGFLQSHNPAATEPLLATDSEKTDNQSDFAGFNLAGQEKLPTETLSLVKREAELIEKALEKHRGKRKNAAQELGISERTLYRKIKDLGI